MAHQVLLFLGAGPNVGTASVRKFRSKGFKVAAVSRNPIDEVRQNADLVIAADFKDPTCIVEIFEQVEKQLGIPNVVIYNAYACLPLAGSYNPNPLASSIPRLLYDLNINTVSPYAAAQEAVKGFLKLPPQIKKTFIFTGNKSNTAVSPPMMTFGMTKGASWYMIQTLLAAFKEDGFRFYYVDERTPEAKAMFYLSGTAHANEFMDLAERNDQGPPMHTFIRGKGYMAFKGQENVNLPVMSLQQVADLEYGKPDK